MKGWSFSHALRVPRVFPAALAYQLVGSQQQVERGPSLEYNHVVPSPKFGELSSL